MAVLRSLTNDELRADPVPVSGPITNVELRSSAINVSGPLTDTQLRATDVDVIVTESALPSGAATEVTLSSIDNNIVTCDTDNVILSEGSSIIGSVKITDGVDTADVIACNGCLGLVTISPGHVSILNSTNVVLAGGATWTGTAEITDNYGVIQVIVKASHDSATNGLVVEFSPDGTNWDSNDMYTITANVGKVFSFQPAAQYYRVSYTNGATLQTYFRLQTSLKPYYVKPSSHRIADNISSQDDAELVKAVLAAEMPGGTFTAINATAGGNLKCSIEELESGISSNSNSQLNVTAFDSTGVEILQPLTDTELRATPVPVSATDLDIRPIIYSTDNILVYGKTGTSTYQSPRIDVITHELINLPADHHEIHEGNSYTVSDSVAVNTTTVKWQVTTPDSTTYAHMIFDLSCTGEATFLITEGSDRTDGTTLVEVNRNRVGTPNTAATIVTRTPTDGTTDGAVTLLNTRTGITGVGGKSVETGSSRGVNEWILKPNTKYVVSITTYADVYVSCILNWYEHISLTA
ncbi:hypothetical protein M0R04_09515 [Candidatus Dojkabacteria bacterium]|jgi:hypothetical protein|nr:hypothetical protein [Candidatus Dojkabacteria bacterium]